MYYLSFLLFLMLIIPIAKSVDYYSYGNFQLQLQPSIKIQQINVLEDTYTTSYDFGANHGSDTLIYVGTSGYNYYLWFKFNISITLNNIKSINFYAKTTSFAIGDNPIAYLHFVSNNSWNENIITWSNQPSFDLVHYLDYKNINSTQTWYNFDITSVKQNMTGSILSLSMVCDTVDTLRGFYSKEITGFGYLGAYLIITYYTNVLPRLGIQQDNRFIEIELENLTLLNSSASIMQFSDKGILSFDSNINGTIKIITNMTNVKYELNGNSNGINNGEYFNIHNVDNVSIFWDIPDSFSLLIIGLTGIVLGIIAPILSYKFSGNGKDKIKFCFILIPLLFVALGLFLTFVYS